MNNRSQFRNRQQVQIFVSDGRQTMEKNIQNKWYKNFQTAHEWNNKQNRTQSPQDGDQMLDFQKLLCYHKGS